MRWLLAFLLLIPAAAHAQTDTSQCATVTVTRATYADITALQKDADCFGAAVTADKAAADTLDAAAAKARSSQIYRLKKVEELKAGGPVGLTPIADNFDTKTGVYTNGRGAPPISPDPNGSFRLICQPGKVDYVDPVVSPGVYPTSHLHQFVGNTGVNKESTYASLRASGQSTCQNINAGPVNRSSYWLPAMLNGIGGVVKPDYWHLYYKRLPKDNPICTAAPGGACVAIPNGLKYVIGYNMATMSGGVLDKSGDFYWSSYWSCYSSDLKTVKADGWNYRTLQALMDSHLCQVGDIARLHLEGPECWDGKNVDSADHRSHLSFMRTSRPGFSSYTCDDAHPYLTPKVGGFLDYTIDQQFVDGKWLFSSDQMMRDMGHPVVAGETFHFDYLEAWSPTIKDRWTSNCFDKHLTCNVGELGDGTQMKDGPNPRPTHQVVPIPPRP